MMDSLAAFQGVLSVLDRLEIPYYVCGSLASSSYGFPRLTYNIDIVASFNEVDLNEFCGLLKPAFFVDPMRAMDFVERGRSLSAIHRKSVFKFNFFSSPMTDFGCAQLERRRFEYSAMPGFEEVKFAICTAEDSILSKLDWYRQGRGLLDQHWNDILGMITVQRRSLDMDYLGKWARRLGLEELLEEALSRVWP